MPMAAGYAEKKCRVAANGLNDGIVGGRIAGVQSEDDVRIRIERPDASRLELNALGRDVLSFLPCWHARVRRSCPHP